MRYLKLALVAAVTVGLAAAGLSHTIPSQKAKPSPKRVGYLAFWKFDDLWICRLDGSGQRRILTMPENTGAEMGFSRRSGVLAWWKSDDKHGRRKLWVWQVTDGAPRAIFTDSSGSYAFDFPSFTPDGRSIIFGRIQLGIWQIDIDGRHLRRLTKGSPKDGYRGEVSVSPDGKFIAFWDLDQNELRLVNRTNGKIIRTGLNIWKLAWSPTGALALAQYQTGGDQSRQRLVLYDPRTRQITPLTSYSSDSMDELIFSPDGRKLAYLRSPDDYWTHSLTLMDITTKRASELTKLLAAWVWLRWGPDGNRIFYGVSGHGDSFTDIRSIRPNGQDERKLVESAFLGGAILAGVFEIRQATRR